MDYQSGGRWGICSFFAENNTPANRHKSAKDNDGEKRELNGR